MWIPSLLAVLKDLARFAFGFEHEFLYADAVAAQRSLPAAERFAPVTAIAAPVLATEAISVPHEQIHLSEQVRYDKQHEKTQAIRTYLTEQIDLKVGAADLTPYEWLAYMYTVVGRSLPWLGLALAPLGYWHQTLKGLPYVTISVQPKTHALMEWQNEQFTGQVGYVSSVTPGETITVEQLGAELPGLLTKQTYTLQEWKELRPVFISVS